MNTPFYIPSQGDTAGTVTDGYASNFERLDTAKADASAMSKALAGKVDQVEGLGLSANDYTDADFAKLARIEAGANNYSLPAATVDVLGGVKVGRNLTVDVDGQLNAADVSGLNPDVIPTVPQVSAADRLLGFNAAGDPVTATAEQVKEFANDGMATTQAMNTALEGKLGFSNYLGDLNDIHTSGLYRLSSGCANTPYGDGLGSLLLCVEWNTGAARQVFYVYNTPDIYTRVKVAGVWREWQKLWHSGNFDPAQKADVVRKSFIGGINNADFTPGLAGCDVAGVEFSSILTMPGYIGGYATQLRIRDYAGGFTASIRGEQTRVWRELYHDGNLGPATASTNGLMSAADKIKLNSVASAMSLSVEPDAAPATWSLDDEQAEQETQVSPEVRVRARRSAQFQIQADELLYDALEAFARNHPDEPAFAAWLEAKDRIREELPKPTL